MRFIILGAPAAGKGTQASKLSEKLKISHISSGEIFRENIKNQTALGKLAKQFIDKGQLVPDDITIGMVMKEISEKGEIGFILDGFPRTVNQADALGLALSKDSKSIDKVINIEVSNDKIMERMIGRRVCSNCQLTYHVIYKPSKKEGICDTCHGTLIQRLDDKEETVRKRLEVYYEQTQPLIDYYKQQGNLVSVNGENGVEQVAEWILKAIE
jgi:adenylate kinase